MATASTRGKNTQTAQPLTRLLWQDSLLEWGIPVILLGGIISIALLGAFEQIAHATGIFTLGCLALLLVGFLLFKPLLMSVMESRIKLFTWGFALVWIVLTCAQFYSAIFVGEEITAGVVTPESSGLELPLGAQGTVYDIVVEGNFATSAGEGGREGGYTLQLEKDGQKIQELPGRFSETLARQRLGRRGSTTTRRLHNHVLHPLVSPGEGTYRLTVTRVDPQLAPSLQIALYRDTYPEKTYWVLSFLLLVGAYIGELWHAAADAPIVLITTAALAFVITFRNLGVPPHSYQDVVGAFLVAALAGPVVGWFFRTLADIVAKNMGITRIKPAVATAGKSGKGRK